MDVYDFSERDDQSNIPDKNAKHKKRKLKEKTNTKIRSLNQKSRIKKSKKIPVDDQSENNSEFNPPIKLKLIRDENDPKAFKSIQMINDFSQSSDYYLNLNQKPLLKCKLVDHREFAVNNIVWAKISGYPFWPSKILSINKSQKCAQQTQNCKSSVTEEYVACVEWLAYDQISYVNCANLSHFHSDYDNKYSTKIKNKKYFEAVNEAKQLTDENLTQIKSLLGLCSDGINANNAVDSVHSSETLEGETSSTLPSHNFTSPESNQSLQSCCLSRPTGVNFDSFNMSNPPSQSNIDCHQVSAVNCLAQTTVAKSKDQSGKVTNTTTTASASANSNWDLPDLGSNLDFESDNHIPEFSDYDEDDLEIFDINKIKFFVDIENH